MKTLIDFDESPVFAIPGADDVGRPSVREGMLIDGPQGWGEFSPASDCADHELVRWLTAAIEPGTVGWPDPLRSRVAVSVAVPAANAALAHRLAAGSGCNAADVTVAVYPDSLSDDVARVEAVRDALSDGAIRCNAGGRWNVDTAVAAISRLDRAAGGLQYVEQPCRTVDEIAAVRSRVDVPVAARIPDYLPEPGLAWAADVAVLSCGPLGGVRRCLRLADAWGLPCVVSSADETSIGLAAGVALAGALPELPFASRLVTRSLFEGDLVTEARSLLPVDGHLPVAPMPPAPDFERLERYAVTDSHRLAWWRERLCIANSAR